MFSESSQLCFAYSQEFEQQFLKTCSSARQHNFDNGVSVHYTQI